jgi:glycosyl transferase family 87
MSLRSARLVVSLGLGALTVAWAVDIYVSRVRDRVDLGEPAQDLGVFIRAASAILDGHSPYVFRADQTYAYPPLLAFLATPLEPLGVGAAMTVSIVVSLAAIAGALWLLGVRDWRCYCLVPLYPVTRSAVGLGTVGPLLLLAIAIAWRWRDRLFEPALAVGAAVALKLFLWPLAIWLAVTRRNRAALAAVAFALALALVPWAAIGFKGLADYPSLLNRLADQEASASYSVYAIGVRLHLPEAAATVLAVAVTAALLAAMVWVGRDRLRTPRDRDVAVLTLALAAALAATPIVWVHYFLLLIVPIALTRPRLSPLWVVPFAYWPLGETAWPGGDARKLALALGTTLVLLAVPLLRGAGDSGSVERVRTTPSRRARAFASSSRRANRSPSP